MPDVFTPPAEPQATALPLASLKVLDLSRVLAGPYAGRLLSDLGADVLKIEPPEGDLTRKMGRPIGAASSYFVQQNIGKRNICVDLKAKGAADLVLALAAEADILIENFRPGVMSRLGLGWEELSKANRKLIMLSISGFGQDGPERKRGAYAPLLHAEAGLIARQNAGMGGELRDLTVSIGDTSAALHGVIAVLAALRHVEHGGAGQHIDISMLNAIHSMDDFANLALDGEWDASHQDRFYRFWDGPEGVQLVIAGPVAVLWRVFTEAGLIAPCDAASGCRDQPVDFQRRKIAEFLLSFDRFAALTDTLDGLNLPWGKVRRPGHDVFEGASIDHCGVLVPVSTEQGEEALTIQSPYKYSSLSSGVQKGACLSAKGKDAGDALGDWLGYETAIVEDLFEQGILHKD